MMRPAQLRLEGQFNYQGLVFVLGQVRVGLRVGHTVVTDNDHFQLRSIKERCLLTISEGEVALNLTGTDGDIRHIPLRRPLDQGCCASSRHTGNLTVPPNSRFEVYLEVGEPFNFKFGATIFAEVAML